MAYDDALADRIRDALAGHGDRIQERKMFGGLTFMVDGHMTVGVVKDELMGRVGADGEDDALENKILTSSPMGSALLGKKVGETIVVNAPIGELKFKIKSIAY